MVLNKKTGKCSCDTTFTAGWEDNWKTFKITIDSTDVKFRDLVAELANASTNSMKTCRIGNEPQPQNNSTMSKC